MIAIIIALIIVYVFLCLKVVGPDEMAIRIILGVPGKFCDSGLHFIPFFPKCYLAKRPKTLFNLDYLAREVITKEDDYLGIHYGSQVIKVDAVAYIRFPSKEKGLIEIIQSKVPMEVVALTDWTEEAVLSALRTVFGQMTWKQAVETMDDVREKADKIFKEYSALIIAGFNSEDLRLAIKEIKLPKGIEKALPLPDKERLTEQAANFVARRQATEWVGIVLESMAQSRGEAIEEIQKEINESPELKREFLDYAKEINIRLEEADRGALTDIKVSGAQGMEKGLLEIIGFWKSKGFLNRKQGQEQEEEQEEDGLRFFANWAKEEKKKQKKK